MSIINEALKKASQEKQGSSFSEKIQAPGVGVEVEFKKKKQGVNWGPVFVLLVLLLISGPIIAPIFSTPFKKSLTTGSRAAQQGPTAQKILTASPPMVPPVQSPDTLTRKAQFGLEETSAAMPGLSSAQAAALPNLSLSGIVFSPAESYCIINEKILKMGEHVNGANLVRVTANAVELDFQGQRIVLYA